MESERVLRTVSVMDLLSKPPKEIDWAIDGVLPTGGMLLLYGPPSSYKTWLMLTLLLASVSGERWLDRFEVNARRPLYVDLESNASLLDNRLRLLTRGFPGYPKELNHALLASESHLHINEISEFERLSKTIDRHEADLVIIDPFVSLYSSDENNASDMRRVFENLRALAHNYRTSIVVVDHVGNRHDKKPDSSRRPRGSSDKVAAFDTAVHTSATDACLKWEFTKTRYIATPEPMRITLPSCEDDFVSFRCTDWDRDEAQDLIKDVLKTRAEISRPDLVSLGKDLRLPEKRIDHAMDALIAAGGYIEDRRKGKSGRGGLTRFIRRIEDLN